MSANGRLTAAELAPIPGTSTRAGGRPLLRKDCAALWNAMVRQAGSVDMAIHETAMRRAYREYAAQLIARNYWCGQGACGNAAVPGTSGHGDGKRVDVMTGAQRAWIDNHGARYGISKRWSDAPWEWWHLAVEPSRATVRPNAGLWKGHPTLRYGARGKRVKHLQVLLRKRGYKVRADGHFGRKTLNAVRHVQRNWHQKPDGVVGPKTWGALHTKPKRRKRR